MRRHRIKSLVAVMLSVPWLTLWCSAAPAGVGVDTPTETPTATDTATETPTAPPTDTPSPTPTPLCKAAPAPGCWLADKSAFRLTNADDPEENRVSWSWARRPATDASAFGDPMTDTTYALCVYGTSTGVASLQLRATVAPGEKCVVDPDAEDDFGDDCDFEDPDPADPNSGNRGWIEIDRRSAEGFRYLDPLTRAQDGVAQIALVASSKADQIRVSGAGPNLAMPTSGSGHLLTQDPEVIVQLVNSDGACWEAHFLSAALTDSAEKFKDKCGSHRFGGCN